jgi:signal transduction histidine kinase
MKISYSIFLGFFTILVLFSVATTVNLQLSEKVHENSEFFEKSTIVIRSSNRMQRNIVNMVSGLRGYLFTGEASFLQSYDSAEIENKTLLEGLDDMVVNGSAQQTAIQEIKHLNERWISDFAVPLMKAKKLSSLSDGDRANFNEVYRKKINSGAEAQINKQLQSKLRDFSNYEFNLRAQRRTVLESSIVETRSISFFLTALSVALGLLIAGFLAYRISTRIVQLVHMADTIAGGNYFVHVDDSGKDELSGLARALNHMSKTLAENIALLKRKNQELNQFAHIVSHDLKAPLRGIDNVATWIEEDHDHELSVEVREYIGVIRGRVVRAENLIRGILSYARIGQDDTARETVHTDELIEEIKDTLPIRSGITITTTSKMPTLVTEKLPLQMIFTNLLMNAITYHDKASGQITVSAKESLHHVEFSVSDNGPGIAKQYHHKIFLIFQTLASHDRPESTGIGLAIVKKILEERNQTIEVFSDAGAGATFTFTWPKHNA